MYPPAHAAQAPDLAIRHLLGEQPEGIVAGIVLHRADQHLADRVEDEDADQRDHEADRADHEHIAVHRAPRRQPLGEGEQERQRHQDRPVAEAELALAKRAEGELEIFVLPAPDADGETLRQQPEEPGPARQHQHPAEHRVGFAPPPGRQRRQQKRRQRPEPGLLALQQQEQPRCVIGVVRRAVEQPLEAPEAVLDGVPGQQAEARRPDQQPQADRAVQGRTPLPTAAARSPRRPTSSAAACARPTSRRAQNRSRSA